MIHCRTCCCVGGAQEVRAVRTIAQRGVLMVATAHGSDIHSLLKNGELVPLLGGVQAVTLGDEEARRSNQACASHLISLCVPLVDAHVLCASYA